MPTDIMDGRLLVQGRQLLRRAGLPLACAGPGGDTTGDETGKREPERKRS